MGVVENTPNLFRQANQDASGFDPTYSRLEKRFSLCSIVCSVFGVLALLVLCIDQVFLSTAELTTPTLAKYQEVTALASLQGHPSCKCQQEVLARGTAEGGFIDNVTFALDDVCGISGEGSVSDLPYNQMFRSMDRVAPPGQPTIPLRHGCKGVIGVAHGWSYSYTPWAECAIIQATMDQIVKQVEGLCHTAQSMNARSLDNFMKGIMVSDLLLPQATLSKRIDAALDDMALQNGVLFYTGAQAGRRQDENAAALLDETNLSLPELQRRLAADSMFDRECQDFRAGSDESINLRAVLEECAETGGWVGRCCKPHPNANITGFCYDPQDYTLPCSSDMVILSHRLRASEFNTMHSAMYAGMVSGMSPTVRSIRLQEKHGVRPPVVPVEYPEFMPGYGPEESESNSSSVGSVTSSATTSSNSSGSGSRRLQATPDMVAEAMAQAMDGGFVLRDDPDAMFSRYFAGCAASACTYTYAQDMFKGLLLLLCAFVGGVTVLCRNCGLGALLLVKKYAVSRSESKVEPDEESPAPVQVRVSPKGQKGPPNAKAAPNKGPPSKGPQVASNKGPSPKARRPPMPAF